MRTATNVGFSQPVDTCIDDSEVIDRCAKSPSCHLPRTAVESFDFSAMKGNWGNRFLICSDQGVENAAFVMYGMNFAQLFDLPEKITTIAPLMQQVPVRYRPVFAEGCSKALIEPEPAQLSGSFSFEFKNELYRAVFLAIRIHPNWSKRLIFGSFNYTMVLAVDKKATGK